MKTFWRINYFITFYLLGVFVLNMALNSGYVENKNHQMIFDIITMNDYLTHVAFINDIVQFVLCLVILLFMKQERTTNNRVYLFVLGLFCMLKFVGWLYAVSGIYG